MLLSKVTMLMTSTQYHMTIIPTRYHCQQPQEPIITHGPSRDATNNGRLSLSQGTSRDSNYGAGPKPAHVIGLGVCSYIGAYPTDTWN